METKLCKKCNFKKSIDDFRIRNIHGKKYIYTYCRECEKEIGRDYIQNHKAQRQIYMKEYRKNNKQQIESKRKEYRKNNIEKVREQNRQSYQRNKEQRKITQKVYRENNKKKINEYVNIKKKTDPLFKFSYLIRNNVLQAFKKRGLIKSKHTEEIVCCDLEFLYEYLLQTYKSNYGYEWNKVEKIHIDHIIPLATAKTEEDIIRLFHYSNLQLLKERDNLEKSNKLNWELAK